MKLTIIGVGGVGGLLAGVLIRRYGDAVSLIARGERLKRLREQGLTLRSDAYGSFTVQPATVTDRADTLPVQDAVLVCVKNGGGIGIFCATGGICAGIAVSNRRKKVNRCQSRNTMLRRCPD